MAFFSNASGGGSSSSSSSSSGGAGLVISPRSSTRALDSEYARKLMEGVEEEDEDEDDEASTPTRTANSVQSHNGWTSLNGDGQIHVGTGSVSNEEAILAHQRRLH